MNTKKPQHNYRLAPKQKIFLNMLSKMTKLKHENIGEVLINIFSGKQSKEDLANFKRLRKAGKSLSSVLNC